MEITGNAFLVTGGASGFGTACVRRILKAGGKAAILDQNQAVGEALAAELGANACFFANRRNQRSQRARAAVTAAVERFGCVRGLVNCAGVLGAARIVGREGPHDLALFRKVIKIRPDRRVQRAAYCCRRDEQKHPSGGWRAGRDYQHLLGFRPGRPDRPGGLLRFQRRRGCVRPARTARELAKFGIRVLAIAPGVFETPMMAAAPDAVRNSLAEQVPFPTRLGRPDEFAQLVQHAIENPYLNGSLLRLDAALRDRALNNTAKLGFSGQSGLIF